MGNHNTKKQIAIIGCGPRGLSSLEALFKFQSNKTNTINFIVTIFEPATHPGAGLVWNLEQSDSNWMNISDRALQNLQGRLKMNFENFVIPSFPSYSEWAKGFKNHDDARSGVVDKFSPRSMMGIYLSERYQSIAEVLMNEEILYVLKSKICKVSSEKEAFALMDSEGRIYSFEECLLTIGHQPIQPSKQITKWKAKSKKNNLNFIGDPYNESLYQNIVTNESVAIRGFGLAAIDIIRLLTVERGDTFELASAISYEFKYIASENSIKQITPFSLDGLPPMPKPIGEHIDKFFKPTQNQIHRFTSSIREQLSSEKNPTSIHFLITSFAEIATELFLDLGAKRVAYSGTHVTLEVLISRWLVNMQTKHELILDTNLSTEDYMLRAVNMALGKDRISLDYCVGQVWRHIQPIIYKELSHSNLPDNIIADIILLDESTKRYSYGPPVESVAQLIALSKAGKLNLNFINDPKIEIDEGGWHLKHNEESTKVHTMIDSVLDAPKLRNINSEIIEHLLKDELLSPVSSELGVETKKDGIVVLAKENESVNLTMLGRNCKGSVIGVDAILECFGPRIEDWARSTVERVHII